MLVRVPQPVGDALVGRQQPELAVQPVQFVRLQQPPGEREQDLVLLEHVLAREVQNRANSQEVGEAAHKAAARLKAELTGQPLPQGETDG